MPYIKILLICMIIFWFYDSRIKYHYQRKNILIVVSSEKDDTTNKQTGQQSIGDTPMIGFQLFVPNGVGLGIWSISRNLPLSGVSINNSSK